MTAAPTTSSTPAQEVRTQPSPLQLRIGIARGGTYTVTTVPLEAYVARVLAGEAARDSRPAALEALAITVRTFALANRGRHRADGFDLCDETHCQVMRTATAATERGALVSAGKVLLRGGVPASVYYTASCGGRTEIPSAVWPGAEDPPFLPSRPDDACGRMPEWTADVAGADLLRALKAAGFRGALRNAQIASRNGSGRVARLKLEGLKPEEISGQDLRVAVGRTLGWQHIMSTAFDLRRVDGAYRFSGHGSGHGVGMCVIGSARLAADGKSTADILNRYFPGLEIGTPGPPLAAAPPARPSLSAPSAAPSPTPAGMTAPEVLVSLPDGDEGERDTIVGLAARARDDLAKALGVSAPSRVALRFHPTTNDYQRATGQAWFTSGALVNAEVHLQPLTVLRDRGVLERTIRHELVHVMTDTALGRRPMWVREGAAIYFADREAGGPVVTDNRPIPGRRPEPRGSCPDDAELLGPVSVGVLSNAYARARACFARQLALGRSWRDVR